MCHIKNLGGKPCPNFNWISPLKEIENPFLQSIINLFPMLDLLFIFRKIEGFMNRILFVVAGSTGLFIRDYQARSDGGFASCLPVFFVGLFTHYLWAAVVTTCS